ncbi:hypothetical protein D9M71_497100 [compost metagenome]
MVAAIAVVFCTISSDSPTCEHFRTLIRERVSRMISIWNSWSLNDHEAPLTFPYFRTTWSSSRNPSSRLSRMRRRLDADADTPYSLRRPQLNQRVSIHRRALSFSGTRGTSS